MIGLSLPFLRGKSLGSVLRGARGIERCKDGVVQSSDFAMRSPPLLSVDLITGIIKRWRNDPAEKLQCLAFSQRSASLLSADTALVDVMMVAKANLPNTKN